MVERKKTPEARCVKCGFGEGAPQSSLRFDDAGRFVCGRGIGCRRRTDADTRLMRGRGKQSQFRSTVDGCWYTAVEIADIANVSRRAAQKRMESGWTVEDAIEYQHVTERDRRAHRSWQTRVSMRRLKGYAPISKSAHRREHDQKLFAGTVVKVDGASRTITEWAAALGVSHHTLSARRGLRGRTIEEVIRESMRRPGKWSTGKPSKRVRTQVAA